MLEDRFGRRIDYVRLSVTDRCDLRCSYCIPKGFKDFEEPEHWLTFDEIERVIGAFTRLGTRRVRLTGTSPIQFARSSRAMTLKESSRETRKQTGQRQKRRDSPIKTKTPFCSDIPVKPECD